MESPSSFTTNALNYLDKVKQKSPENYVAFLHIMRGFKSQSFSTDQVIAQVQQLFSNHHDLQKEFEVFLPVGYQAVPPTVGGGSENRVNVKKGDHEGDASTKNIGVEEFGLCRSTNDSIPPGQPLSGSESFLASFEDARQFVLMIKNIYQNEPHVYIKFLEVLHNYHQKEINMHQLYLEIVNLFQSNPHLIQAFTHFLPQNATVVGGESSDERNDSQQWNYRTIKQNKMVSVRRVTKLQKILNDIITNPNIQLQSQTPLMAPVLPLRITFIPPKLNRAQRSWMKKISRNKTSNVKNIFRRQLRNSQSMGTNPLKTTSHSRIWTVNNGWWKTMNLW